MKEMRVTWQVGEEAQRKSRQLAPVKRTVKVLKLRGHSEGLELLQYV